MGTKKIIKKQQKTVFLFKKLNQEVEKRCLINKQCLGGYFDLSFKTKREFFFKKSFKKLQVLTLYVQTPDYWK